MVASVSPPPFVSLHRKPKAKRKRKGWGPFQSVLKERSVAFNLTLDVQNLQQEIQRLITARDLLESRVLTQRHSPTGSLMKIVREYLHVFRNGFRVEQRSSRRHVITAEAQTAFLHDVIDENIEFEDGNRGVEFLIEQNRRWSLFWRVVRIDLNDFEIVQLGEDTVLIKASGTTRFQVLRETVAGLFPHLIGNECLQARLIGNEVCSPSSMSFYFNARDKINRFEAKADFVVGFHSILKDAQDVLEVLGQAKITDHATIDAPVEDAGCVGASNTAQISKPEQLTMAPSGFASARTIQFYMDIAHQYVDVFASGWQPNGLLQHPQSMFIREFISPRVSRGLHAGHEAIKHFWEWLTMNFEVHQMRATKHAEVDDLHPDRISLRLQLEYELGINEQSFRTVFACVVPYPHLLHALLGATIKCPSELHFQWETESDPGIRWMNERLNWDTALGPLLPNAQDRKFVLDHASLEP